MRIKLFIPALAALACSLFALASCEKGGNNNNGGDDEKGEYMIAASSMEATYLLQTDDISKGELTIVNAGMEVDNATAWVFYNNKYAYRLVYNQGNAGIGSSYMLDAEGKLVQRNVRFEITNRFTTYGPFGKYIITAASGATAYKEEGNDLPKYGVTFTYIDVEAQTLATKTIVTEDLVGNGEYFTVSGIVDVNGKLYTALCPQGLSEYGVSKGYAVDESLIEDGYVTPTQYPDNVWVAIYDNVDFENPKILHDTRISYATSRYRSQFYSTIVPDAGGNVYVFSASNAKTNEGIQKTTKPSGVIRIKAGAEEFDQDYYFNIEEASGGRQMFKVWHISEDYYLLQMYHDIEYESAVNADTRRLAIFKAGDKNFKWVETGLPERSVISSFGSSPYFENGLAYMPVVTTDGAEPTVYIIDPAAATATKGVVVTSSSISAIGKLGNN